MPILQVLKLVMVAFWIAGLINLLLPFSDSFGKLVWIILIAHVVEVIVFNNRLKVRPQPWLDRVQVLLFGVLHVKSLR